LERHATISQKVKKTSVTFARFAGGSVQTAKEISISKIHHSELSVTNFSFVDLQTLVSAATVDVIPSSQNAVHLVMTSFVDSQFSKVISEPARTDQRPAATKE